MALVGLVVVSHSRRLAEAAVDLALEMVHGERPPIVVAAGMPDGGFGTDATAVMAAIEEASVGAGVVVLVDLGSAVMSAEMACEFLDDPPDVKVVAAPFVEGLLAAAVVAAGGGTLESVAAEAAGALHPKLVALDGATEPVAGVPDEADWGAEARAETALRNRDGLHARPAAMIASEAAHFDAEVRLVHERGAADATSPIGLATLAARFGDPVAVEARGPEAAAAVEAIRAMIDEGFGEDCPVEAPTPTPAAAARIGVSPGRVVGVARRMVEPMAAPPEVPPDLFLDTAAEAERIEAAVAAAIDEYRDRARTADPEASAILVATAALAADPTLLDYATRLVSNKHLPAANAFWQAADYVSVTLANAGGRMAERATDVVDIRDRVVSRILGLPMPGVPDPGEPFVLVARDLAPSDTVSLSPETCLAIVTAEGGPTSHTSILARAMGIPAVVGAAEAADIPDGARVLVDGTTGEVVVDPAPEQAVDARTGATPLVPLAAPGRTADGVAVPLLANIGSAYDAQGAAAAGAEGVGLFRTEFCFLGRGEEPGHAEQVAQYSAALARFPGRKVVIRTLDAGSDKPLPFLTIPDEPNPALGVRGYRTDLTSPGVLERQLRAIADAAGDNDTETWVMAPMISTPDEASEFAALARGVGLRTVGVMIETPSAALQAAEILERVDFVSVGTNDLTQYVMAADREATSLGRLQDPWQPAVLRLLERIGGAATAAGKPAGVCGEAASDPGLAPVLVGLGFTTLSMSPRQLTGVAAALAAVPLARCRAAAAAACTADSPAEARRAARAALEDA